MGRASRRKRTGNPFAGLNSVTIPDGTKCQDCTAAVRSSTIEHDDTCPHTTGLDRVMEMDRSYFDRNPDADQYVRPITRAEASELKLAGQQEPLPAHILVTQIAPGVRKRQFLTLLTI